MHLDLDILKEKYDYIKQDLSRYLDKFERVKREWILCPEGKLEDKDVYPFFDEAREFEAEMKKYWEDLQLSKEDIIIEYYRRNQDKLIELVFQLRERVKELETNFSNLKITY